MGPAARQAQPVCVSSVPMKWINGVPAEPKSLASCLPHLTCRHNHWHNQCRLPRHFALSTPRQAHPGSPLMRTTSLIHPCHQSPLHAHDEASPVRGRHKRMLGSGAACCWMKGHMDPCGLPPLARGPPVHLPSRARHGRGALASEAMRTAVVNAAVSFTISGWASCVEGDAPSSADMS